MDAAKSIDLRGSRGAYDKLLRTEQHGKVRRVNVLRLIAATAFLALEWLPDESMSQRMERANFVLLSA